VSPAASDGAGAASPEDQPTGVHATDDQAGDESKGERTRRRLLEIAVAQFGSKGYRTTSVTEITRQAGLTQAASYAYFDSKADLFRAAVNHDVVSLITAATEAVEETPVRDLLPSVLALLASKLDEHPLATRLLGGQEPDAIGELRDLPALVDVRGLLAQRLIEAQHAGEVRGDVDPERLAAGLVTVLLALLMSMTIGRGGGDAADPQPEIIAGILELFSALVRPPS
jgi:AcrR family transcriptional regulator